MSDFEGSGDKRPDVLSKADEFIKRRRAQIGSAVQSDNIPLLTDVVADASQPTSLESVAVASHLDISTDITRELDVWLDENLPQVLVHVMDGITDKLIQQVLDSAREDLLPRIKHMLQDNTDPGKQ